MELKKDAREEREKGIIECLVGLCYILNLTIIPSLSIIPYIICQNYDYAAHNFYNFVQRGPSIRAAPESFDSIGGPDSATDETAAVAHNKCPIGADSWCRYQAAIAQGLRPPKHPNYLGPEAVQLVKDVFDRYNYDKQFFVEQIAEGQTSNHNEALHNILFTMIPKTNAISYTTMRLGSALAVIRYNGGFTDLLSVFEILGISCSAGLQNLFYELDRRVSRSYTIQKRMKQRFDDRQTRTKRELDKIKKHGEGYASGKYSASSIALPQRSLEELEIQGPEMNPELPYSKTHEEDAIFLAEHCGKCGIGEPGSEEDTLEMEEGMMNWVECSDCCRWYHYACAGIEDSSVIIDCECFCINCLEV